MVCPACGSNKNKKSKSRELHKCSCQGNIAMSTETQIFNNEKCKAKSPSKTYKQKPLRNKDHRISSKEIIPTENSSSENLLLCNSFEENNLKRENCSDLDTPVKELPNRSHRKQPRPKKFSARNEISSETTTIETDSKFEDDSAEAKYFKASQPHASSIVEKKEILTKPSLKKDKSDLSLSSIINKTKKRVSLPDNANTIFYLPDDLEIQENIPIKKRKQHTAQSSSNKFSKDFNSSTDDVSVEADEYKRSFQDLPNVLQSSKGKNVKSPLPKKRGRPRKKKDLPPSNSTLIQDESDTHSSSFNDSFLNDDFNTSSEIQTSLAETCLNSSSKNEVKSTKKVYSPLKDISKESSSNALIGAKEGGTVLPKKRGRPRKNDDSRAASPRKASQKKVKATKSVKTQVLEEDVMAPLESDKENQSFIPWNSDSEITPKKKKKARERKKPAKNALEKQLEVATTSKSKKGKKRKLSEQDEDYNPAKVARRRKGSKGSKRMSLGSTDKIIRSKPKKTNMKVSQASAGCWYIASGYLSDIMSLLDKFEEIPGWRFSNFSTCWQQMRFSLVYRGRQTFKELLEFSEEIAYLTKRFLKPPHSTKRRIGALYTLYGLYFKHPVGHFFNLRFTHEEYTNLLELIHPFRSNPENPDPAFILKKLEIEGALRHTATMLELCHDFQNESREYVDLEYGKQRLTKSSAMDVALPKTQLEADNDLLQCYFQNKAKLSGSDTGPERSLSMLSSGFVKEVEESLSSLKEQVFESLTLGLKDWIDPLKEKAGTDLKVSPNKLVAWQNNALNAQTNKPSPEEMQLLQKEFDALPSSKDLEKPLKLKSEITRIKKSSNVGLSLNLSNIPTLKQSSSFSRMAGDPIEAGGSAPKNKTKQKAKKRNKVIAESRFCLPSKVEKKRDYNPHILKNLKDVQFIKIGMEKQPISHSEKIITSATSLHPSDTAEPKKDDTLLMKVTIVSDKEVKFKKVKVDVSRRQWSEILKDQKRLNNFKTILLPLLTPNGDDCNNWKIQDLSLCSIPNLLSEQQITQKDHQPGSKSDNASVTELDNNEPNYSKMFDRLITVKQRDDPYEETSDLSSDSGTDYSSVYESDSEPYPETESDEGGYINVRSKRVRKRGRYRPRNITIRSTMRDNSLITPLDEEAKLMMIPIKINGKFRYIPVDLNKSKLAKKKIQSKEDNFYAWNDYSSDRPPIVIKTRKDADDQNYTIIHPLRKSSIEEIEDHVKDLPLSKMQWKPEVRRDVADSFKTHITRHLERNIVKPEITENLEQPSGTKTGEPMARSPCEREKTAPEFAPVNFEEPRRNQRRKKTNAESLDISSAKKEPEVFSEIPESSRTLRKKSVGRPPAKMKTETIAEITESPEKPDRNLRRKKPTAIPNSKQPVEKKMTRRLSGRHTTNTKETKPEAYSVFTELLNELNSSSDHEVNVDQQSNNQIQEVLVESENMHIKEQDSEIGIDTKDRGFETPSSNEVCSPNEEIESNCVDLKLSLSPMKIDNPIEEIANDWQDEDIIIDGSSNSPEQYREQELTERDRPNLDTQNDFDYKWPISSPLNFRSCGSQDPLNSIAGHSEQTTLNSNPMIYQLPYTTLPNTYIPTPYIDTGAASASMVPLPHQHSDYQGVKTGDRITPVSVIVASNSNQSLSGNYLRTVNQNPVGLHHPEEHVSPLNIVGQNGRSIFCMIKDHQGNEVFIPLDPHSTVSHQLPTPNLAHFETDDPRVTGRTDYLEEENSHELEVNVEEEAIIQDDSHDKLMVRVRLSPPPSSITKPTPTSPTLRPSTDRSPCSFLFTPKMKSFKSCVGRHLGLATGKPLPQRQEQSVKFMSFGFFKNRNKNKGGFS